MVNTDTGKQPTLEPKNSVTPDVYIGTSNRFGTTRPVNYRALVQEQDKPKEHSAIVYSQLSSSSSEKAVHSFISQKRWHNR